jgi:hypothetical protein
MGEAKIAPPAATNAMPIARKVLKNFGVGAFTRSTTFISFGFVIVALSFVSINFQLKIYTWRKFENPSIGGVEQALKLLQQSPTHYTSCYS